MQQAISPVMKTPAKKTEAQLRDERFFEYLRARLERQARMLEEILYTLPPRDIR